MTASSAARPRRHLLPGGVGLGLALVACGGPQRPPPAEATCSADARIVIGGQDDVAAAARCLTVESLTIRTGAALDLGPLRDLHVVLGELRVGPSVALEELRLPGLHSAGAITIAGNGNLHGVFLPKLTTAGAIAIERNVELATVSMPRLARVRGDVMIAGGGSLELVEVSSLVTVEGALVVRDNPRLTLLEAGALERAKSVTIDGNAALDGEIVERLRTKTAP